MNKNNKKGKPEGGNLYSTFFITFIITIAFYGFFFGDNTFTNAKEPEKINYVELVSLIEEASENEETIKIKETSDGKVNVTIGQDEKEKKYESMVNPRESGLADIIEKHNVEYEFVFPVNYFGFFFNILFYGVLIAILLFWVLPMLKTQNIGKSNSSGKSENIPSVTFDDIGGISDEVKNEILQVVALIKEPERAKKLGIKPSKGILLHGPPGTGKTLIAKALANSYDAEFIAAEGSSFVEMFAGLGAKRARELFAKARKNAPAVIFIDEIDAIGKKRSSNGFVNNDEREQTLNQILVNLDGVEELNNVYVVAATNRLDVLDPALLRPGRFDYKIKIDLPDVEGRREIIDIHSKNKALSQEVKDCLDEIAESTSGYSGADIESLFEKAGYFAFSKGRDEITMGDINDAIDRIIIGNAGRKIKDKHTKKRVAYHEAGHALLMSLTKPGSIRKATIVPRGQALGYVAPVPKEGLDDKNSLLDHLKVMVAGGVAEKLIFGSHSNGVSDDFKKAKELIGKMVEDWGMGGNDLIPSFSEKRKTMEMETMYEQVVHDTTNILEENKELLCKIAELLLKKETVDGKEIESLKDVVNNDWDNDE